MPIRRFVGSGIGLSMTAVRVRSQFSQLLQVSFDSDEQTKQNAVKQTDHCACPLDGKILDRSWPLRLDIWTVTPSIEAWSERVQGAF